MDDKIFSGAPESATVISVVPGGLTVQNLSIGTKERGFVKFRLVAQSEIETGIKTGTAGKAIAKASDNRDDALATPFQSIRSVDITVTDKNTGVKETFRNLKAIQGTAIIDGTKKRICEIDSLVPVAAGTYSVSEIIAYFDAGRKISETNKNVPENEFTVKDNMVTGLGDESSDEALRNADVPVVLNVEADYLKDAVALKEIWLEHDGPKWAEQGCSVVWNFDSDVTQWLSQPGVQTDKNGRVSSIQF